MSIYLHKGNQNPEPARMPHRFCLANGIFRMWPQATACKKSHSDKDYRNVGIGPFLHVCDRGFR
jgi:hypothetical protein